MAHELIILKCKPIALVSDWGWSVNYLFYSSLLIIFASGIYGRGNKAHNNFIKYNFQDNDKLGPQNWSTLSNGKEITNYCRLVHIGDPGNLRNITPGTPLNILTSQASLPIRDIEEEFDLDRNKPSITFQMKEGLHEVRWRFGYPTDVYYGLEIRGPRLGLIQLLDSYDPPTSKATTYDFNFAFISFCDMSKAAKGRSSHQLNGKRFPLEINMVFFSEPREIGIDNSLYPNSKDMEIVMVSVLGEIGKNDNPLLDPVIKAAKTYKAGDFDMDDTDDGFFTEIGTPFSPSWLLPQESQYYYYRDGSFPVPPCFPLAQVYVFKTPIKLSVKQLGAFTSLKTDREPNKTLSCTFGLLRQDISPTKILYNPYPHKFVGIDNRPDRDMTGLAVKTHVEIFLMYISAVLTIHVIHTYVDTYIIV